MPVSFDGPNSRDDVYTVPADWQPALPLPPGRSDSQRRPLTPGTYYLIGNLLGLGAGIGFSVLQGTSRADATTGSALDAAASYLVGNASASMMTLGMLIFLGSCYVYDRAFKAGANPDQHLIRVADAVSGFGAVALGIGLLALGEPILALTSGLLHAWGKFGSALWHAPASRASSSPLTVTDFHRMIVVASRFPAIIAALLELNAAAPGLADGAHWTELAAPAVLLACYVLWLKADLQLFAADRDA